MYNYRRLSMFRIDLSPPMYPYPQSFMRRIRFDKCNYFTTHTFLLLLDTATASFLRSLNRLLVRGNLPAALERTHESTTGLEWALQIPHGGIAHNVNLDKIVLEDAL